MYELRVLSGLYQGASLPLIGNEWTIGASEDDDLAIFEPGFAATELVLTRASNQFLLNGEPIALETPWQFEHIWLVMCHAATPWENFVIPGEEAVSNTSSEAIKNTSEPNSANSLPSPNANPNTASASFVQPARSSRLPLVFICVLTTALCFWLIGSMAQVESHPQPRPAQAPMPEESPEKSRKVLLRMLKERELLDVGVTVGNETIKLSGSLVTDEELQRLQRMVQRFNKQHRSTLPIANQVVKREYNLPFTIRQVTTGPIAHLVTAKGDRLFVGDEIEGVRLVAITDNTIRFSGKFQLELAW